MSAPSLMNPSALIARPQVQSKYLMPLLKIPLCYPCIITRGQVSSHSAGRQLYQSFSRLLLACIIFLTFVLTGQGEGKKRKWLLLGCQPFLSNPNVPVTECTNIFQISPCGDKSESYHGGDCKSARFTSHIHKCCSLCRYKAGGSAL